ISVCPCRATQVCPPLPFQKASISALISSGAGIRFLLSGRIHCSVAAPLFWDVHYNMLGLICRTADVCRDHPEGTKLPLSGTNAEADDESPSTSSEVAFPGRLG